MKGRFSRDLQPTHGSQGTSSLRSGRTDRHVSGGVQSADPAWLETLSKEQLLLEDEEGGLNQSFRQQSVLSSKKAAYEATSLKLDLDAWHLPPAIAQVTLRI